MLRKLTTDVFDSVFDIETLSDGDNNEGTFSGKAAVFNQVNSFNELLLPGAFTATLKRRGAGGVGMLWQHNSDNPIGVWEEIVETAKALIVKGRLVLDTQKGAEAYALLKAKAITGLSIGFNVPKGGRTFDPDTGIGHISMVDLLEISPVMFPSLDRARVSHVRNLSFKDLPLAPKDTPWAPIAAQIRVAAWAEPRSNADYRQAFLWFDENDRDNREKLQFLIADVIDDKLMAIPKALVAAATVMATAPAIALNEDDILSLQDHIDAYYTRMAAKFDMAFATPWRSDTPFYTTLAGIAPGIQTTRDFETFLRDSGFSRQEAQTIVSKGFQEADGLRDSDPELAASVVNRLQELTALLKP